MKPFTFERASDVTSAVQAMRARDNAALYLAGGTTLLDLMKLDVMQPSALLDINALENGWAAIDTVNGNLRLGALAKMADAADNRTVQRDYPLIAQTLQLAASPQIRNMARLGGNVLQRTRCTYFRDVSYTNCNKRIPGSGCAAMEGINRTHAVLGTSDNCIATYPGDFAQALIALDAQVEVASAAGLKQIAFSQLHREPGSTPEIETTLAPGDLITSFQIPGGPWRRSLYLKIRDRQSYEFALASAAVALDIEDRVVRQARIALGGVATRPWRAQEAEQALVGKAIDESAASAAAEAAFAGATARAHNAFKVELGKRTLTRALLQAAAMEI